MFGKLKEKLKGWITKTKEEAVEEPVEEKERDKLQENQEKEKLREERRREKEAKKEEKRKLKEGKKEEKLREKEERKKKKEEGRLKKKEAEETAAPKEVEAGEEVLQEAEEKDVDLIAGEIEPEKEVPKVEERAGEDIEPTVERPAVEEEKPEEKKGFFARFKKSLTEEKFDELFEELSLILLQNNVAFEAVEAIKGRLKGRLVGKSLSEVDLAEELKGAIEALLINPPNFIEMIKQGLGEKKPFVIVFAGINGSGKTTTIAKVAEHLKKNGFSVCLAAADTFRAASIEQIATHAKKLEVELIKKDYGADPASVGFDAVAYAKKHAIDVVLIDTAGRMQNKDSLMREMEKIVRVNKPDMKIFLGESITGNDATQQAKAFNDAIDLTGIILSKADVDEKGGTAISVSYVTGKPILFLGTGQEYKDLEVFDKSKMIEKLGLG